jgi:hypothetical protein
MTQKPMLRIYPLTIIFSIFRQYLNLPSTHDPPATHALMTSRHSRTSGNVGLAAGKTGASRAQAGAEQSGSPAHVRPTAKRPRAKRPNGQRTDQPLHADHMQCFELVFGPLSSNIHASSSSESASFLKLAMTSSASAERRFEQPKERGDEVG